MTLQLRVQQAGDSFEEAGLEPQFVAEVDGEAVGCAKNVWWDEAVETSCFGVKVDGGESSGPGSSCARQVRLITGQCSTVSRHRTAAPLPEGCSTFRTRPDHHGGTAGPGYLNSTRA